MHVTTYSYTADIVRHLITYMRNRYEIPDEIVNAITFDPRVEVLDRIMAFRADEWYDEFRSALSRIERGNYGVCTVCAGKIDHDKLARQPTTRICDYCLRQLDISEF